MAKTNKAKVPISDADDAIPFRRSSKIFGSAKVVPWKITLEIAVVKKITVETLTIRRLSSIALRFSALIGKEGFTFFSFFYRIG